MSKALERFCSMLKVMMLWEVALSVLIGVGGCGWPISIKVVRGLLSAEEDCTGVSLGGGYHDGTDGLALSEYRVVWGGSRTDGWRGGSVAQIVMACSTTACFGLNKVRCVTVNVDTNIDSLNG